MKRYQDWYPQLGPNFAKILRDNCTAEYEHFLVCRPCPKSRSCCVAPFIECLLDNTGEVLKANVAQSSIILGLLPTLLAYFGSNTVETGLLTMERPFLAFLIGAGTPAVWPVRTFDYLKPMDVLHRRKGRVNFPDLSTSSRALLSISQYLIVSAAVVNLYQTIYEFMTLTVDASALESQYRAMIYLVLSIPIHVAGALVVWLQIDFSKQPGQNLPAKKLTRLFLSEFRTCVTHTKRMVRERPETYKLISLSWALSLGIVLHIIWGTIVMAGALFISVQDATFVAARIVLSAIVCRIVLMSELSGLRESVTCEDVPVLTSQTLMSNQGASSSQSYQFVPSPDPSHHALLPTQTVKRKAVVNAQPTHGPQ